MIIKALCITKKALSLALLIFHEKQIVSHFQGLSALIYHIRFYLSLDLLDFKIYLIFQSLKSKHTIYCNYRKEISVVSTSIIHSLMQIIFHG